MKTKYFCFLLSLMFISCSSDIEITNYIDSTKPFELIRISKKLISENSDLIKVESKDYLELLNWFKKNNHDWKSTPASYISEIVIIQENFSLLVLKDMKNVVLNFVDENGNSQQYIKPVNPEDLEFLLN